MILERWRGGATIRLGLPPGDLHVLEDVLEDDLREQDLIAAGDLAGHAALHLHHALAVREVQTPQNLNDVEFRSVSGIVRAASRR